jgi:hypothetical protein
MSEIYKYKNYTHFDNKIKADEVSVKVENSNYVEKHSFFPFVKYIDKQYKFDAENYSIEGKKTKIKQRPIMYSSHIDRYIYQWYSYNLNDLYSKYAESHLFSNASIAYRTGVRKCNIDFAKQAFDFIEETSDVYILVSDFHHFFDNLDHEYLKEMLKIVLNVERLPEDYYKVYRSLTKYSFVMYNSIIKEMEKYYNKKFSKREISKRKSFFEDEKINEIKNMIKININKEEFGIPQGSPLSGVLANIYMIEFDEYLNNYATKNKGLYMRYSDDIILVIPKSKSSGIDELWKEVMKAKDNCKRLEINPEKTNVFEFNGIKISSLHDQFAEFGKSKDKIDYLGFCFDGEKVYFREKTLFKFYHKLNNFIDVQRVAKKNNKKVEVGLIFKRYLEKNSSKRFVLEDDYSNANFYTYAKRAANVFKDESEIVRFKGSVKKHIKRRLNQK